MWSEEASTCSDQCYAPSPAPSKSPTPVPTNVPSRQPTLEPTGLPSLIPSRLPSLLPTASPSLEPTPSPTEACPAGTYQTTGEATEGQGCEKCMAGKYQNQRGQTSCIGCSMGKIQNRTGATDCYFCPAGKFNSKSNVLASDHDSISDCDPCASGKLSNTERTNCRSCEKGEYAKERLACQVISLPDFCE